MSDEAAEIKAWQTEDGNKAVAKMGFPRYGGDLKAFGDRPWLAMLNQHAIQYLEEFADERDEHLSMNYLGGRWIIDVIGEAAGIDAEGPTLAQTLINAVNQT